MPKKYLVLDDGTLPELALGLTKDGNEVKYYTNYPSTAPEFHEYGGRLITGWDIEFDNHEDAAVFILKYG